MTDIFILNNGTEKKPPAEQETEDLRGFGAGAGAGAGHVTGRYAN